MGPTMKSLRFHGNRDIRLDDIAIPPVGENDVKLRLAYCGICGSDLHEWLGGPVLCPTAPHPLTGEQLPIAAGHEFSGIIEEVGQNVQKWKPGDRVCVQPILYDGTCVACKEGAVNCCQINGFIGYSCASTGGLADYIVVDEAKCFLLPENVSLELGALVEPLAVAWHAVKISPFKEGDWVLVLGGGPIGLVITQALKARSKCTVIVSEISPRRKEYAKQFGADYVLDPTQEDIVARCKELCGLVHVAFDCAGVAPALQQAILATRARGTIVNVAVWERPVSIQPNDLVFRERNYMGIATYVEGDFQEVLDCLEDGRIKPEAMISLKVKLQDVIEGGFERLIKEKDKLVKVLVEMNP
ncbi:hypothetical protein NA57DRAFT_78340 [Rhizodiscina lignyota]|uniref:Enoyl reductase (ER) domain-containing protein n=1 Tax=Rhizodiscina lignyota TaxID=1504668 RepID=A0A9P4M8E8_9PEZI|nr:hypothetical protein NA57DRAFT_78340 [Rhizodiscina lignyota]